MHELGRSDEQPGEYTGLFRDPPPVPAGKGVTDYYKILKKLYDTNYNGFLSLEPHLGSFEGLAALELDDKMEKLPKGGEGTFTLAHNELCEILKKL